jgi:hypothetical protein
MLRCRPTCGGGETTLAAKEEEVPASLWVDLNSSCEKGRTNYVQSRYPCDSDVLGYIGAKRNMYCAIRLEMDVSVDSTWTCKSLLNTITATAFTRNLIFAYIQYYFAVVHKDNGSFYFFRRNIRLNRYRLDGPGIEFRWGRNFQHPFRPDLGPTQPLI